MRIDCVLDVGANTGQFADRLRRTGYTGHIVSFEPMPREYAIIAEAANRDARWHTFNFALGSKAETKRFNVLGSGAGTVYSSFLDPLPGETPAVSETIAIEVRRLDDVFDRIEGLVGADARHFLKIDTQGYDLEVCKGGEAALPRMLGLQSEVSIKPLYAGQPGYIDALAYYEALGFALMNLSIVNRTAAGSVLEYDCLMARPAALAG
nr:FkbM family methyltransferase [Tsuneonella aeria]